MCDFTFKCVYHAFGGIVLTAWLIHHKHAIIHIPCVRNVVCEICRCHRAHERRGSVSCVDTITCLIYAEWISYNTLLWLYTLVYYSMLYSIFSLRRNEHRAVDLKREPVRNHITIQMCVMLHATIHHPAKSFWNATNEWDAGCWFH